MNAFHQAFLGEGGGRRGSLVCKENKKVLALHAVVIRGGGGVKEERGVGFSLMCVCFFCALTHDMKCNFHDNYSDISFSKTF